MGLQRASDAARRPFCLAPHGFAFFLALADVARLAEMARISTLRSRLGPRQKEQQRDPLQYFNSLLRRGVTRCLDSGNCAPGIASNPAFTFESNPPRVRA